MRLLTLTGIGGVGKTRLAVEVARSVGEAFTDAMTFVGLASLADASLLAPTVMRSLDQREAEGVNPGDGLRSYLRDRHLVEFERRDDGFGIRHGSSRLAAQKPLVGRWRRARCRRWEPPSTTTTSATARCRNVAQPRRAPA